MPLQTMFINLDDKVRSTISEPIDWKDNTSFAEEPQSMVQKMLKASTKKKVNFLAVNELDDED